jgi:DnaJ-domain-containing protein 1
MELLKRYSEIEAEIESLRLEQREITDSLERHVHDNGELSAHGYRAYMKLGRKSTRHQDAAKNAPAELVEKYSVTKTTVSWAKITKEMGIDLTEFTSISNPIFDIKKVK